MKPTLALGSSVLALLFTAACGPSINHGDDDDDDNGGNVDAAGTTCTPVAEVCNNGLDEDCDGLTDCDDADCETACANCGEIEHPEGTLALPDGEGNSYMSSINFSAFAAGQMLPSVDKFKGICVNMEHSWLRDLQIEMSCPSGRTVVLQMFLGQTGSEVYMGAPNDSDGTNPVPGTGMEYCWTPTATNPPMLTYVNNGGATHPLPPGDYQAVGSFADLVGCPLNGPWTIKVTDLWAIDNGFIFSWSIKFDPSLVSDCSMWPPIG